MELVGVTEVVDVVGVVGAVEVRGAVGHQSTVIVVQGAIRRFANAGSLRALSGSSVGADGG